MFIDLNVKTDVQNVSPISPHSPKLPQISPPAVSYKPVTPTSSTVHRRTGSRGSGNDPLVLARFQCTMLLNHVHKRIAETNPSKQRRENMVGL